MKKKYISFILFLIMALFLTACSDFNKKPVPEQTEAQYQAERFDVSEELTTNFYAACESIGIPKDDVQLNFIIPSEDGTTFNIDFSYEVYSFDAVATSDYNISDVVSGDVVYIQNGTIISNANHLLTLSQYVTLQNRSEDDVKTYLISPATADFPGHTLEDYEWNLFRDENIFTVSAWVDSQNENGALIRQNFTATYEWDGSDDTEPVLIDVVFE